MRIVRFISHEKEIITTDSHAMRFSGMVTCKEKKLAPDEDLNINMLSFKASLITRIVRWAEHHRNDNNEQAKSSHSHHDIILTEWDNAFVRLPINTLIALHLAAVIFSIPDLVELIQEKLWNATCNRSEAEMIAIFEAANVRQSPEPPSSSDDDTSLLNKTFTINYKEDDIIEAVEMDETEKTSSKYNQNPDDNACSSTSNEK